MQVQPGTSLSLYDETVDEFSMGEVEVALPLSCVFLGIKSPTPQQLHLPIKHAFATVASGHGQEQSEKHSNHFGVQAKLFRWVEGKGQRR